MSARCLITVNIGNFLTEYSRKSFRSACDRWKCDFAEVHQSLGPLHPACSKYLVPKLFSGYDEIMLLDADTVVSDHAPSPFGLIESENILYAVSDYQAVNQCKDWTDGPYLYGMSSALTAKPEFVPPPPEKFFNGGMWLCRPTKAVLGLFSDAAASLTATADLWIEQGTINVFAHNSDSVKVELLPETWNHMIPQDCKPVPEFYINHFGGWAHELLKQMDAASV